MSIESIITSLKDNWIFVVIGGIIGFFILKKFLKKLNIFKKKKVVEVQQTPQPEPQQQNLDFEQFSKSFGGATESQEEDIVKVSQNQMRELEEKLQADLQLYNEAMNESKEQILKEQKGIWETAQVLMARQNELKTVDKQLKQKIGMTRGFKKEGTQ